MPTSVLKPISSKVIDEQQQGIHHWNRPTINLYLEAMLKQHQA